VKCKLVQNIKPENHEDEVDHCEVEKHLQVRKLKYALAETIIEHNRVYDVEEYIKVRGKITLT